ncbi:MAG: phosphate ABC transporter permease subunit PstC [Treponema sp.]|jgi:phosphate transport system permease protein|nr:phosphate ABC transporter permease subunit PstC [Treponema sp.]
MISIRQKTDVLFKRLFAAVSFSSVLALGAMLLFIFIQGTEPFVTSTARGIRLVTERIDAITVNGVVYQDPGDFIELPPEAFSSAAETVSLSFAGREKEQSLRFAVNRSEADPEKQLSFFSGGELPEISCPEAYIYTATYPGIPGMEQKIHILLPELPYSLARFLGGLEWRPSYRKLYGIFPMIRGTILAAFGALLLGLPPALLSALFLAEFVPAQAASVIRAGIELLAGIPSVVYGFFGLMVIVPFIKNTFHTASGNSLLAAVIVLAVMILPTITTIAETALRAVPQSYREASLALGASKMQTAWAVVLPHARSGVITGVILGISRAVGETMAVILVAGNSPQLITSPLDSVRTLTATVALEMGYSSGRHSQMLFSIGVVLFIFILALNSVILQIRRRGRRYENEKAG